MATKPRTYTGNEINVSFDNKRCIHAAECVHRLSTVFDIDERPWIQPDNDRADAVAATVHQCPSGALQFERLDGGAQEEPDAENTLQLVDDGPVYIRGDIDLASGEETVPEKRVALCRCGMSENKPYCDNSHIQAGFKATNAMPVIEAGEGTGGKLRVTPAENGPVHVEGDFMIQDGAGETIYQADDTWLCRCGASQNKPFCDGTHNKIGFTAPS